MLEQTLRMAFRRDRASLGTVLHDGAILLTAEGGYHAVVPSVKTDADGLVLSPVDLFSVRLRLAQGASPTDSVLEKHDLGDEIRRQLEDEFGGARP